MSRRRDARPRPQLNVLHDRLGLSGFAVAPPPGTYDADPWLRWQPATRKGIERPAGALWSGHVNDVVPLIGGGALVAADTGGVWLVSPDNTALPLSDAWAQPRLYCMAVGPTVDQVIALGRGGSAFVTDWTGPRPHLAWMPVPLPARVVEVHQAVYWPEAGILVLADNVGIHWAPWPATPTGPWTWTQVPLAEPDDYVLAGQHAGGYSGLALGPDQTMCVAYWGHGPLSMWTPAFHGIDQLRWDGTDLRQVFRPVIEGDEALRHRMRRISLASSPADRHRMYAVASGGADDGNSMLGVWRSDDGGRHWRRCGTELITAIPGQGDLVKSAGNQGDYNNTIAASPVDPDVVALGFRSGPYLSEDGGNRWRLKHDSGDNPHLHSDVHVIRFDIADPDGQRFLVGTDGGVAITEDLGDTYRSAWNANLATLQFAGIPARQFRGSFAVSPVAAEIVAGGMQDNGVAWTRAGRDQWWHALDGGDGYHCVILATGQLVFNTNRDDIPRLCEWYPTIDNVFGNPTAIPVTVPQPGGTPIPKGLRDRLYDTPDRLPGGYRNTLLGKVRNPSFHRDTAGYRRYLYALASVYNEVYGMFASEVGTQPAWEFLGTVPIDRNQFDITALSSCTGSLVYVGTGDGRIFVLDSHHGTAEEMTINPHDNGTAITGLVAYNAYGDAFAVQGVRLLRMSFSQWVPVPGLPDEQIFSIEVDELDAAHVDVFAATDSRVYSSRDAGKTWRLASAGLPIRPQNAALALGRVGGHSILYLATWGRSVWATPTRPVTGAPPLRMALGDLKPRAELGSALRTMSVTLSAAGRAADAAAAGIASAGIIQQLLADPQDLDASSLRAEAVAVALSLPALSGALWSAGDQAGSVEAKRERVRILELLTSSDRATYLPSLVDALVDETMYRVADVPGAVVAGRRSVYLGEELAGLRASGSDPAAPVDYDGLAAFIPGEQWHLRLQQALFYWSYALWDSGDRAGSLTVKRDRVKVYDRLVAADRATYLPFLIDALVDETMYRVGDVPGAVVAGRRAVYLGEELAGLRAPGSDQAEPVDYDGLAAFTPGEQWHLRLQSALFYWSHALWDSGDQARSLTAKRHRVKVYERLVDIDPATYGTFLHDAQTDLAAYTT